MAILVIAEHDNATLKPATLNTAQAARELSAAGAGDITVLVAGAGCAAVGDAAASIEGVAKVLVADDASLEHGLAENMAALIVKLAGDYSHLLAPASTAGKNFMPRAAALLDVQQVSEISAVVDADTFVRPIYAGNAMATVKSNDATKVMTVRSTTFEAAPAEGGSASVEAVTVGADTGAARFIERTEAAGDRPELTEARVVISGGRGMASGENYALIEPIADKLGAAMGASRAAVDAGFVPNDWQVGQTGKVVAPELYIAIGISGAIQHLAGMKDSKVIVAINKDEEAPIFQVADYGLVADLFKALPELDAELEKQG
ncbi:MAG: electron transfer flavoprotein subunit alpha/FixB family protein [Rhodospirillaceae bacterium]|jgi:electron transfer flavoprotein alpha subunit|nr:electron transfer flavoprotein subunit alpha/FixB family protein [Rhodospirillaceae bacterium]MBT6536650.1 electron transfer flavoprotein subunit alpha/FixB family protein [Rhodospirillaceae bacterium]